VFAFTTTAQAKGWDVYALSRALRERGWQVPAYSFPDNRTDLSVLRIVCRHGFSLDMADLLLDHLDAATDQLEKSGRQAFAKVSYAFQH
jgi:glutamate decarboxylase